MDSRIKVARELIKMAKALVSNDESTLDNAIENGVPSSEDKKEDLMDVVDDVVNHSGDNAAKELLKKIHNGFVASPSGKTLVAFDFTNALKKIKDSAALKAVLVALLLQGMITPAMAKDFSNNQGGKVKQVQVQQQADKEYAKKLGDKVAEARDGDAIVEEKDGWTYVAVSCSDDRSNQFNYDVLEHKAFSEIANKYGNFVNIEGYDSDFIKRENDDGTKFMKALTISFRTP